MSIVEPLFRKSRHFMSCYDDGKDEKNKTSALLNLRRIAKFFLSQGYGVIYGVEEFQDNDANAQDLLAKRIINVSEFSTGSDKQYDTIESVQAFRKQLLLINPESIRAGAHDSWEIVDHWLSEYAKAGLIYTKESLKPLGIIGISNPSPFYEKKEIDLFVGFEQTIERAFGDKLVLICCYKKKWLEMMTLPQLIRILNTHGSIINSELKTITFDSHKIIEIISETIDSIAIKDDKGNDNSIVSTLLFGTIRHAYQLDERSLVFEPDKLENVLTKMLGKQSYKEIGKEIVTNLIKKIFEHSDSRSLTENRRKESE